MDEEMLLISATGTTGSPAKNWKSFPPFSCLFFFVTLFGCFGTKGAVSNGSDSYIMGLLTALRSLWRVASLTTVLFGFCGGRLSTKNMEMGYTPEHTSTAHTSTSLADLPPLLL
jgi:hypothetical protein